MGIEKNRVRLLNDGLWPGGVTRTVVSLLSHCQLKPEAESKHGVHVVLKGEVCCGSS